ncbi:MAG TPA: alpha/beta hydrolase fold domain-containing protein [Burkholderiales bacterium]|nr:alpha/beta hydrolase fold domain-containing protein [Burkholderiales bacterium]
MTKVFLGYDQKALDDQYEQRVWVPHADQIIQRYAEKSDAVRKRLGEPRVERYGPTPRETLDVYGSGNKAFVFVHGGAWKRQSSREQGFLAEPIVQAGATYIALNFALLPSVTMAEMVGQVCRALEWIKKNLSDDIALCGHSSGGHLAACALIKTNFVRKAMVVSGIYDLLPVRLSARNDYVRLNERLEHEYSPIRHVDSIKCPVSVGWAEEESAEFLRQSKEFASVLRSSGKLSECLEGKNLNHFQILETMADPRSPLGRAALNMLE